MSIEVFYKIVACVGGFAIGLYVGFRMGLGEACRSGLVRGLNIHSDGRDEPMWRCVNCQYPNAMDQDYCGVCGLDSSTTSRDVPKRNASAGDMDGLTSGSQSVTA